MPTCRIPLLALALAAAAGAHAAREAPWACPGGPFGPPVNDGTRITRIADALPRDAFNDFGRLNANVEGPVWRNGALLFSEFDDGPNPPPTRIVQRKGEQPGGVWLAQAGTNGLAVDRQGTLYGASHAAGGIVRLGQAGDAPVVVADRFKGARFNAPNDLAIRSDGTVYFTDPTWQAPVPPPQAATRVYRLPPGSRRAVVVDAGREQPNGVTLSPDEKTLYVSSAAGLYKYAVAADGSTGRGKRFAPQIGSADGMVVDCAGNLYVTAGDIVVLDRRGAEIARLGMPGGTATNLAFGGPLRQTLFITAMGAGGVRGLYQAELAVPGMPY